MDIGFYAMQVKPLLEGLITQTIVPYTEETMQIKKGDLLGILFENEKFKGYQLKVLNIKRTSIEKLSNKDISSNGFLYKPHFLSFMQEEGFDLRETILSFDFLLVEE